jgi:hypothetical protein
MNDQVKTADGYNFGGTSYKNEERTDSQGKKYSVAIPISSVVSQAPQPQFQTPVQQAPTDYNSMTTDIATPYDIAVQQQQQNQLNAPADITNLMNTIAGKSAFEAQQNEATGLNTANQEAIRKAAEISALGKQAAAAQQENISQGRQLGSVSSFVAGQGAEIERNRAIKALSLGAELDAIQGNIAVAQSKVKQAVDAQYAGKELALANKLKMFELNQSILGNLTSQQQKAFEQAKYKVEQEQKRLTEEKRSKEDIQNMIIEATPNAPANIVANAKKLAESGASKLAVAQALGVYGGDYLKTALLKEQIQTERAQRNKIYSDMAVTASTQSKAEADSWVTNIASGKAKLSDVPAKLKSLVSLGLSQTAISSPETKAKIEASQSVYDLAQELLTAEGKGGAVGAGFGKALGAVIPGYDGTAFAGTDRATYEAKFSQLKDTLASSNLDKLKGAMSDKDIEFLRNIGTALKLEMPESAFDAELKKVQKVMTNVPGVKPKAVENKFSKSLGQSTQQILGTEIINNVTDDGSIDFKLP